MNNVTLIGRLVRDVELRFVPNNGRAVANFTLAVDKGLIKEKKAEFEAKGMPTADFIRIVVWGKQAENCANYLAKGRMVAINGSISVSNYKTPSGETRYSTDVVASHVEFLEWGDKKASGNDETLDFYGNYGTVQSVEDDDDIPF